MIGREHTPDAFDLRGDPADGLLAPGKRAPTDRIPVRAGAGTQPPELMPESAPPAHDDPFGLHLEQASAASTASTATGASGTTAKDPPPPPAEKQSRAEKLEEGRWKFAFFFTGGRYGKHARSYLETYYPNHERHDARSMEEMFEILGKRVPKLEKQREKHDSTLDDLGDTPFVEEIIIVSHGTAAGSLKVPMMKNDKRIFTPWDVSDVQAEVEEGAHQRFESRRKKALRGITADTRLVVRGCEIGDSRAAMVALQTLFGGKPTVFAPHHFQGFQTEQIGGARLKTWKDAFRFLLDGGYIPSELAEEDEAAQKKYVETYFGDGIPSEFFLVSQEDHDALDRLYKTDPKAAMGPAGEQHKTRVDTHESMYTSPDWAVLETADPRDVYGGMTTAEIVAEAERVWATYRPEDGATIMRLYEDWKKVSLAELQVHDGEHERPKIDTRKINTKDPLPQIPDAFSGSRIDIASADAAAHPANRRTDTDEWQHQMLQYERPDDATVDGAHDFTQSERHAEQVAGPEPAKKKLTPAQRTRAKNRKLVGDLLAGVDAAARYGLDAMDRWDLDTAREHASVATRRIQHLLSITHLPGKVEASLGQFRDEAALALGRSEMLAGKLFGYDHASYTALTGELANVRSDLGGAGWKWKAIGLDVKKTAGKFKRSTGTRIGTGTLAMVEHRARFLEKKSTPDAVKHTAAAIAEELGYAREELARAAETDEQKAALEDEVRACAKALRQLENLAWIQGVGDSPELDAMRAALEALHGAVDIHSESSRLRALAPTTGVEESRFLFAILHYIEGYRRGEAPDVWIGLPPELDAYAGKVRVVAEGLWSKAKRDQGGLARSTEVWGEARYKVFEIIQRARAHSDGDGDGELAAAIDLAQASIAELEHDLPRARAAELAEQHASTALVEDPESGFYQGVDAALGAALTDLGDLHGKMTEHFIEMGDEGWAKNAASAKFDVYNIVTKLWAGDDSLRNKVRKAQEEGLNVQTVAELVETVIDLIKDLSELFADGLKYYATWKAGQVADDAARASWKAVAEQAGHFEFKSAARAPGQWLGAALGAAQIVTGLLDFREAMRKDDTRGMVAAGHSIAQGGAGLAGALVNASIASQALVAGTIFLWWATIDAMGTLGGHLAGMARNRKLRAVESLVGEAGKLASVGRDMAGAWDAYNTPQVASDPWMDAEIREMLRLRAERYAEYVLSGIDTLAFHITKDDPDYVGGYDDLRQRIGPAAESKLTDVKTFSSPGSLTYDCNTIFLGIDRMARYAMAAGGPDRGSEGSKAQREAIDAEVDAERDRYEP